MMGSFLSRGLLMVFGYAYPAYKCFKVVEKDEPQIEKLLFWCQYWILVAFATVCERVGDAFVSWLPLYGEAKLALFIYLWHRKTKGTKYMYNYFCRNLLTKHEVAIDRNLLELRNKAEDLTVMSWQKASKYGLTRFFETLEYTSSQSQLLQRNDGEAPVIGRRVFEHSNPEHVKASDANITLQDETPPSENGKPKGSQADGEDRKTGVFRAAMNRLRSRKSPHRGK